VTDDTEYRIERLRHRLAHGELAELGVRVEARGSAVIVSGAVADAECREVILRAVAEELDGLHVQIDLAVAPADEPARAEEL